MAVTGAYIQPEDLPAFYDTRRLCQLASDTGTPCSVPVFTANPTLTGDDVAARARVEQLCLSVSGEIDSACLNGKKYAMADLEALAASGTKSGAVLKRMAADLWFGELVAVRGYHGDQVMAMAPRYELALEQLKQLGNGDMIFNIDYALDASVPSRKPIGQAQGRLADQFPFLGRWDSTQRW